MLFRSSIQEVVARPGAKILYEQTKEFGEIVGIKKYNTKLRLINQPSLKGKLVDHVNNAISKADKAGYDAISFSSDSDIGTVILNKKAFII